MRRNVKAVASKLVPCCPLKGPDYEADEANLRSVRLFRPISARREPWFGGNTRMNRFPLWGNDRICARQHLIDSHDDDDNGKDCGDDDDDDDDSNDNDTVTENQIYLE